MRGKTTLKIMQRKIPIESAADRTYPAQPVVAVGAVVIHQNRVLLVKRGHPPAKDTWALPGGKVELGETLQQAAEREILEETGIVIQAETPVYAFDMLERDHTGGIVFHYVIVDLAARYISGIPTAADDAAGAQWVLPEELAGLPINGRTRQLLKEEFGFGP